MRTILVLVAVAAPVAFVLPLLMLFYVVSLDRNPLSLDIQTPNTHAHRVKKTHAI